MNKFLGAAEEFKQAIDDLALRGAWEELPNGLRYRTPDGGIVQWFATTKTVLIQGTKAVIEKLQAATAAIYAPVSQPSSPGAAHENGAKAGNKIFVVHGHDHASREQLELIIHKLGLEPFVLANTSGGGLTIIEALEANIGKGGHYGCGIVLLTPDDMGYAQLDGAEKTQPRARQNVVLEMGMLMAAVGRRNTIILKKGNLEVPSDAGGLLYLNFQRHVKEVVPRLAERLQAAGFSIEARRIISAAS
jgi:predicted nucleotide-binding protein